MVTPPFIYIMHAFKLVTQSLRAFFRRSPQPQPGLALDYACPGTPAGPTVLIIADELRATYYLAFHLVLEKLHHLRGLSFYTVSSQSVQQDMGTHPDDAQRWINDLLQTVHPNLVVFSRYGLPHGEALLNGVRAARIPTAYYIDDDLIDLPDSLGQSVQNRHGNTQVLQARKYLLSQVDQVYTSTTYLQKHLGQKLSGSQPLVLSTYPPYLNHLIQVKQRSKPRPLTIGYMASKGHAQDLAMVVPALCQILTDHPQVRFETFGTIAMPRELSAFSDQVAAHKGTGDYQQFLQKLYDLNWAIGLAPLQDTPFNRCKSPVKFIEYTSCSIPTLASDIPVYNQFLDGVEICLATPENWYSVLSKLIEDRDLRIALVKAAQAKCQVEFALEKVAEDVFNTLISDFRFS
jgi:glycosyltransferase involved in cell wall biosynthesis